MKNPITNAVGLIVVLFAITISAQAQIIATQYRYVPPENTQEFIERETTYWSEVAKEAIKQGKMAKWELWQRVGGTDLDTSPNFLFVNIFDKKEDIDNLSDIWGIVEKLFPDKEMSEISTNGLSTTVHAVFWQPGPNVGTQQAQFMRANYVRTPSPGQYAQLEDSLWRPFIEKHIQAGTVKQTSWGVGTVLIPAGSSLPFNAVTVDGYQQLSEAISPSFPDNAEFPDLTALNEIHQKVYIQTYALVKAVDAETE